MKNEWLKKDDKEEILKHLYSKESETARFSRFMIPLIKRAYPSLIYGKASNKKGE